MTGLEAAVHDLDAQLRRNSTDWFQPQSFDPIGVKQEIHRQDAKSAKKVGEPAHNPFVTQDSDHRP